MKKFIAEYLHIIAYTAVGLVFVISSFYLVMNYYHSRELSAPLYIRNSDSNYGNYISKIEEIKTNLETFSKKSNKDNESRELYGKLASCNAVLGGEGTLATLKPGTYYKPVDVYKLGSKFQTDLLNICWAIHLSYLIGDEAPTKFKTTAPYIKNTIDALASKVEYSLDEIQNNSSYYFNTNITASTIRDPLAVDYENIASSYNEFADIILNLSKDINQAGGEVNE